MGMLMSHNRRKAKEKIAEKENVEDEKVKADKENVEDEKDEEEKEVKE